MTARPSDFPRSLSRISGRLHWLVLIVLLILGLVLYFYSERVGPPPEKQLEQQLEQQPVDEQTLPTDEGSGVDSDLPEPPATPFAQPQDETNTEQASPEPAPDSVVPDSINLATADASLHLEMASGLAPEQTEWLLRERLIERLVVTVNGLDGDGVPLRLRPLTHVPGLPAVEADGEQWRLSQTPDPRYQPYREILDALDPERLVDLYFEYQPAFEQAWIDLGMVDTDFQSRLIEVIDHLLAFQPPEQVPQLIRPEVLYEFSDPALEQASWGHKLLIRIGPEHSNAVKRKLAAVRQGLVNESEDATP